MTPTVPGTPRRVRIAATNNNPELVETIPITKPGQREWQVVMRLGPETRSDDPMPDLAPGDRLHVFAELEVTTDAKVKTHPGLIGQPYAYSPRVEARFLLSANPEATAAGPRTTVLDRWDQPCSHERHHQVVLLSGKEIVVPPGFPQDGFVNLVLSASHRRAKPGQVLLVGENEATKTVDQNVSGIRLVRLRPGDQPAVPPIRQRKMSARKIAVAKQPTVVLSMPLRNLRRNEQVLVHGRVRADARPLGYHARLSARMFLADGPADLDPESKAKAAASWKGNLSKENGFNCLRDEGPSAREKFGVARILADTDELWVNVVATSSAPFEPNRTPGHKWPLATGSFIEVRRYGPELFG